MHDGAGRYHATLLNSKGKLRHCADFLGKEGCKNGSACRLFHGERGRFAREIAVDAGGARLLRCKTGDACKTLSTTALRRVDSLRCFVGLSLTFTRVLPRFIG